MAGVGVADLVLSPVIENLVAKLGSLVNNEVQMLWGFLKQIENLSWLLRNIQAILVDAEERQRAETSVVSWLKDLKVLAYKAEDIIDEYATRLRLKQLEEERLHDPSTPISDKVRSALHFPYSHIKEIFRHHNVGSRMKEINDELEQILKIGSQFLNLSARSIAVAESAARVDDHRLPTSEFPIETAVYGRDGDKERIMSMLSLHGGFGGESSAGAPIKKQKVSAGSSSAAPEEQHVDHVSSVAIIGMGGIGKTTLARKVFKEADGFDYKIWIYVSESFDVNKIIDSIIESIDGSSSGFSQLGLLQSRLGALLTGKKLFLVLDDVWNENPDRWRMVQVPLEYAARGSKLLVTTRNSQVASAIPVKTERYHLKRLSKDACWSLIQQKAFANGEDPDQFLELVAIGQEISGKCEGVPLTAVLLGSLLCSKRQKSYWSYIKDARMIDLSTRETHVFSVLRWSYNSLSTHLKQCFVYSSIFPKGTEIFVHDLIQQWMAHGFIQPSGGRTLEDIGYDYFDDLLQRSFFQDISTDEFGGIEKCKIHDIVHDLAKSIMGDEGLIVAQPESVMHGHSIALRHLTICNDAVPNSFQKLENLRTFSIADMHSSFPNSVLDQIFSSLKYLRVLNLPCVQELPQSICDLIHLRCLKVNNISVAELPNSITDLLNLHALEIKQGLRQLPRDLSRLRTLGHLDFGSDSNIECMPPNIGQLTCLQKLSGFAVTQDEGCGLDELGALNRIGGSLLLSKLENVRNHDEAKQAKLKDKQQLQKLYLDWSGDAPNSQQVLEDLCPTQNLKYLNIFGYHGVPSWLMTPSLSNLVELCLNFCGHCNLLPPLLQFPSLEYVTVTDMEAAGCLEFSVTGCPRLKTIHLRDMIYCQWYK